MKLHIQLVTRYDYSAPLLYALQSLCLTPQGSAHQTVHAWSVQASGTLFAARDGYGNVAHTCSVTKRVMAGAVSAVGTVETHDEPELVDDSVPEQLYLRPTSLTQPHVRLAELGGPLSNGTAPDAAKALALARAVLARVPYKPRTTTVRTTAMEALALGGGVCQDQAHVYIAACRAHGVPARYVSGYFHAPGADHLASHAWVDVCVDVPSHRWLSVDVTHGCVIDERHVRLAVGPDYAACSPIRGVREGGGEESMRVRIDIRQESNDPAFSLEP